MRRVPAAGSLHACQGWADEQVGVHDRELVEAHAVWRSGEIADTYRAHRPMVERTIAWLVARGHRKVRYRGVERNQLWLATRVAAINLRRLVDLGLATDEGGWVLSPA